MRVLVTGHRGYVGSHLVPELERRGHAVIGLDAGWFEGCDFGPPPPFPATEERCDIRDQQLRLPAGLDAVIHLAGLSNDPLGDLDPAITHAINADAAVRLATMVRQAGIPRFLFASTCSVYGAGSEDLLDETAPLRPLTPYAEAKASAERAIAALTTDDFSPVFLRPGTAYGRSARLRGDLVVNNLVAHALLDGEVLIKSDGSPWRPIVHVADVARAFADVLEAPREATHGMALNVGHSDDNYRVSELADAVAAGVPGSRIRYAPGGGPDRRTYRVDCSRIAARVPAFRPRWTLADGIADLVDGFRRYEIGHARFFGTAYFRLQRIRELIETDAMDQEMRWQREPQRVA